MPHLPAPAMSSRNDVARRAALCAALLALPVSGCGNSDEPAEPGFEAPTAARWETLQSDIPRDTAPNATQAELDALVRGNHDFTLDMHRRTAKGDTNSMISGFSIRQAFGMLYLGARGTTETEISSTLRFDTDQQRFHTAYNALDLALAARNDPGTDEDEPVQLYNANRLWLRQGQEVYDAYLDMLALNYGAGVERLDFMQEPELCRQTINGWVEDRTADRIKNLLPMGSIQTSTAAVLTNAIYFKAPWDSKFEEPATRSAPFTTRAGDAVDVEMMNQLANFPYAEGEGWQAVELPYRKGELSMVVLLPEAATFAEFEARLTSERVEDIVDQLEQGSVQLAMPKWKFETTLDLIPPLRDMGMDTIFSSADLSGMMDGDFQISGVFHKTFVAVDEGGTEAAAATAIVVQETSAPVAMHEFVADRPFIFIIRDIETDAWLFFGRVTNPSGVEP